MAKTIIDVSEWVTSIDFKKVKDQGISGVIIRAGWGNNNVDAHFKTKIEGAINAGLPVGIYWMSYAYTKEMADREAKYCLDAIAPYKITLPVFFDWEYDSANYFEKMLKRKPTEQEVTDMYLAFMSRIFVSGYKAGYYTNPDFLSRLLDEKQVDGYYKWLAFYVTTPQTDCDIWQYDAKYIAGCTTKVDMNILNNENLLKDFTPTPAVKEDYLKYSDCKVVSKGSQGTPVKVVQSIVNTAVDGIFGTNTDTAVRGFQGAMNIDQDGIVGEQTWEKLLNQIKK